MSNKSKFVEAMINDFMESYGLDESGKLTVVNESVAKKTDSLLSKIVLEKSVAMFDKLEENSTEHLQGLADEISFQELNGDGSTLNTDTQLPGADQGQDQGAPAAAPQGGFDFDLPESIEAFDLNSLFEMEDEEEEESEEEGELKEFAGDEHGFQDDEAQEDDGQFQDLDLNFDDEGGDLDDAGLGDQGDLGAEGGDLDNPELGGDADEVNLDDGSDPFDFDFDLPGEDPVGLDGDENQGLDGDDEDEVLEAKKAKKGGTTKKMGIVPNDRKSSKASLA